MRPKCIVYCLAAICLVFGWNGVLLVEDVDAMIEAERTATCYTQEQLEILKEKILSFEHFMILAIVLSIVMSVCASLSKRCR
jgi:hypothetical protein